LKFTKEELPWFSGTFLQSVIELKKLIKLFNPIADAIAEYGTIDDIAILEVEAKGPRKITWRNPVWPDLFKARAIAIPSDKVTLLNHDGRRDNTGPRLRDAISTTVGGEILYYVA